MKLATLIAKYSLAGVLNTVVGYGVIFACMAAGVRPLLSNITGYAVGLVLSFVQNRYWVFRSAGSMSGDALRFLSAFLVSFALNLLTLQALLSFGINPYVCQVAAGCVYVGSGFLINHLFVFRKRKS